MVVCNNLQDIKNIAQASRGLARKLFYIHLPILPGKQLNFMTGFEHIPEHCCHFRVKNLVFIENAYHRHSNVSFQMCVFLQLMSKRLNCTL